MLIRLHNLIISVIPLFSHFNGMWYLISILESNPKAKFRRSVCGVQMLAFNRISFCHPVNISMELFN